jgi:hypothetical protein
MKRPFGRTAASLLSLAALALPGCLYAHVRVPLDTDLNETKLGAKRGEATNRVVLGLFAWGDGSTQAAAANGGITTLNQADTEFLSILFIVYNSSTTIVYGD